jgi:hypothetical protein
MDDYAAHKRAEMRDWLAPPHQCALHSHLASWLNLVEVWFCITERQANHRGTFGSMRDLTTAIRRFINSRNNPLGRCRRTHARRCLQ